MIEFEIRRPLRPGLAGAAWSLARDVALMPRFWGGHREVAVVSSEGGRVLFRVRFAFPGPNNVGLAEAEVDDGSRALRINYLRGPLLGRVDVEVHDDTIVTRWRVRAPWYMAPLEPWLRRHFMDGAKKALERLAEAAEVLSASSRPTL